MIKSNGDASEKVLEKKEKEKLNADKEVKVVEVKAVLDSKLEIIGNLVHDSVPVSNDEVCGFCCFLSDIP